MPANIDELFKNFPQSDYWKLLIDVDNWGAGPLAFDRDSSKGYLKSISRSFYLNLETINEPVTMDLIQALHRVAYHQQGNNTIQGRLVDESTAGIGLENMSKEGLAELISHARKNKLGFKLAFSRIQPQTMNASQLAKFGITPKVDDDGYIDFHSDQSPEEIAEFILNFTKSTNQYIYLTRQSNPIDVRHYLESSIQEYNKNINSANDQTAKLTAIVKLVKDLHQYHPFGDGNGRTFIFMLLNKLLMMNNMPPTILSRPGMVSGFSTNELVNEVVIGQDRFKQLCTLSAPNDTPISQEVLKNTAFSETELQYAMATINLTKYFNELETNEKRGEFITQNQDALSSMIETCFNKDTVNQFLEHAKLTNNDYVKLLETSFNINNPVLHQCMIEHLSKHDAAHCETLRTSRYYGDIILKFDSESGSNILKSLGLISAECLSRLTDLNSSPKINLLSMISNQNDISYAKLLIKSLSDDDLKSFLRFDFGNINGAQLISLYFDNNTLADLFKSFNTKSKAEFTDALTAKIDNKDEYTLTKIKENPDFIKSTTELLKTTNTKYPGIFDHPARDDKGVVSHSKKPDEPTTTYKI